MADEKKCFVIMPITTPAPMIEKYHNDKDHFRHVYDRLFAPSIREAGFTPIPPKAEGSDFIHAGIVGNLESADLVLCDMSCLNPNVFFEWGIRTALNKPVCIVKDELTAVPFDTGILNHQEYNSAPGWELEDERKKLAAHITASAAKTGNDNALWKYLALAFKGRPYQVKEGNDGKLDLLAMQMESIAKQMERMTIPAPKSRSATPPHDGLRDVALAVGRYLDETYAQTVRLTGYGICGNRPAVSLWIKDGATKKRKESIEDTINREFGATVEWDKRPDPEAWP